MAARRGGLLDLDLPVSIAAFPTLHIDPRELDSLRQDRGGPCELRRSVLCPCIRNDTGKPRSGCKGCRGTGRAYPESLRQRVTLMVTSREARARSLAAGKVWDGTAMAVFPLGMVPARGDLILPDGDVAAVEETLYRSVQEVDTVALDARKSARDMQIPPLAPRRERFMYPDPTAIEYVHYIDPDTEQLVEAREGFDYVRTAPDLLTWQPGRGPAQSKGYTVRYLARAAYIVVDSAPMIASEHGSGYPYRANVQRLERWGEPDIR